MKSSKYKGSVHYVIVGNSAAGISAAREIKRCDPCGNVTIISDESTFGYSRVMLPLYIAGKIHKRDMLIAPRTFYASNRIHLLRKEFVGFIDPKDQHVQTQSGKKIPYDRLLIATGSSSRRLNIPGDHLRGIHFSRRMTDAEAIKSEISSTASPVAVIGGGLVSVKSIEALIARKRKAHLVISSNRILSQMLDQAASDLFLRSFEQNGVKVHFGTDVKAFQGKDHLENILLSDGTTLSCSLAIIGKGVRPNIEPLLGTGATINQGLLVDLHMATNLPYVYAAGDVAEQVDVLQKRHSSHAIWPLAVEGGRVAGSNMAGVPAVSSGAIRMNSVEILGTRIVSSGEWEGKEEVKSFRREGTVYRKLVFSGRRLRGFLLAGDLRGAGTLTSLMRNDIEISPSAFEEGLERGFSYWPRLQVLGGHIEHWEEGRRQA
jgi:NAD(P)H-nitrite reductase large subunit